ncbi:MAG TPA: NAD-dependent epimerase/dehydratase family protein [Gaiellaceae bacterium]|nr:NAD-dependent epimerase/dehydratase family protein [Gaiellaceae bacterium]
MSALCPVLVTGATGYVGGRLLPSPLARGEYVRCLARRPEAIAPHPSGARSTASKSPTT